MLVSFFCGEFTHPVLASYTSHDCFLFLWEVSLTLPMLASFLCGEFLLYIPYWLYFYLGTFSYTSLLAFFFLFSVGSSSYTSHAGFSFSLSFVGLFLFLLFVFCCCCFLFLMWWVSLTHPVLASFLCGEFLLHILYWLYFFIWGHSLTHPWLLFSLLFFCGEFVLHIPCWLFSLYLSLFFFLNGGSFS